MSNRLINNVRNRTRITQLTRNKENDTSNTNQDHTKNIRDIVLNINYKPTSNKDINYDKYEKDYNNQVNDFKQTVEQQKKAEPYKVIFKDADFNRKYKQTELIIHKVSSKDKEGVEEEYDKKMHDIKSHNKELKKIYGNEELEKHKKKFEYNNSYKYRAITTKPSEFTEMKNVKREDNDDKIVDMDKLLHDFDITSVDQTNNSDNSESKVNSDDNKLKSIQSNNEIIKESPKKDLVQKSVCITNPKVSSRPVEQKKTIKVIFRK